MSLIVPKITFVTFASVINLFKILMGVTAKNIFIWSRSLYAALDYIIDARASRRVVGIWALDGSRVAGWALKGWVAQNQRTALVAVSFE